MNSEWLITWKEEYPDGHTSEEQYIVGAAPTCQEALRIFVQERPLSLIEEIRNLRCQKTQTLRTLMTLEQAMNQSSVYLAFQRHLSGGVTIVDGGWTSLNPHFVQGKDEDTYWVQQPNHIVRDPYHSLDDVKQVVSNPEGDVWQPYEGE